MAMNQDRQKQADVIRRYRLKAQPVSDILDNQRVEEPDAVHYLGRVLRLKEGDDIELFDGHGRFVRAKISACLKKELQLMDCEPGYIEAPSSKLHLIQAVPKGKKIEQIVRQCTEFGVRQMTFFYAERSQGRHGPKLEKLSGIVDDAIRQSGQYWAPHLEIVNNLDDALKRVEPGESIFFGECTQADWPCASQSSNGYALVIGPEGGLGETEKTILIETGAQALHFAPFILRTETAGLAGLSAIYSRYMISRRDDGTL